MVWILRQQSQVKRKELKEDKIEKKQKKKVSGYREVKEMASKESAVGDEEHQKWDLRDVPWQQGKESSGGGSQWFRVIKVKN